MRMCYTREGVAGQPLLAPPILHSGPRESASLMFGAEQRHQVGACVQGVCVRAGMRGFVGV